MRRTLAFVIVALALPSVALAAKPHTSQSKAAPKVMYILKGTLSNYAAASTTVSGAVTIHVTHSNYHAAALVGQDLAFAVSANTKVGVASNGTIKPAGGLATVKSGTRGIVKFQGALKVSSTTLMAALAPNAMTAFQVIVQHRA